MCDLKSCATGLYIVNGDKLVMRSSVEMQGRRARQPGFWGGSISAAKLKCTWSRVPRVRRPATKTNDEILL